MYTQDTLIRAHRVVDRINKRERITLHPLSIHYNLVRSSAVPVMVLQDPLEVVYGAKKFRRVVEKVGNKSIVVTSITEIFGYNGYKWDHLGPLGYFAMPLAEEPDEVYYEIRDQLSRYLPYSVLMNHWTDVTTMIGAKTPRDRFVLGMCALLLLSLRKASNKFNTCKELLELYEIDTPLVLTSGLETGTFLAEVIRRIPEDLPLGNEKALVNYFKRLMRVFLG